MNTYYTQYQHEVKQFTDHELYIQIKKNLINVQLDSNNTYWRNKLIIIKEEAEKRGLDKLIKNAIADGFELVAARHCGLPIPNVNRIDFMNKSEMQTQIRNARSNTGIQQLDIEKRINGIEYIVNNLTPTLFIMYAEGDSMLQAGIEEGDALIVESAELDYMNKICVVSCQNYLYVKKIIKSNDKIILKSANPKYPDYYINDNDEFKFVGVLKWVIKKILHNF